VRHELVAAVADESTGLAAALGLVVAARATDVPRLLEIAFTTLLVRAAEIERQVANVTLLDICGRTIS